MPLKIDCPFSYHQQPKRRIIEKCSPIRLFDRHFIVLIEKPLRPNAFQPPHAPALQIRVKSQRIKGVVCPSPNSRTLNDAKRRPKPEQDPYQAKNKYSFPNRWETGRR